MNKLLNPISWTTYLETIAVLAIAYYAFIGWKYYQPEIKSLINRITGQKDDSHELPAALRYEAEDHSDSTAPVLEPVNTQKAPTISTHTADDEPSELEKELTACIAAATDKPFAPAALIPKLKKILNDYPEIAAEPEREYINAFIVRECERTGTALLSESEVDLWWSA